MTKMKIEEMNNREKSILLAKAAGWDVFVTEGIERSKFGGGVCIKISDKAVWATGSQWFFGKATLENYMPDLYQMDNIHLAWQMLNWWHTQDISLNWYWGDLQGWFTKPLGDAIRIWLDLVLKLAIEGNLFDEPGGKA